MDKKYHYYSVTDFTQDIDFIKWVNKGVNQKEWENFVHENPDLSKNIYVAKKIVSAFRYKTNDFQKIDEYELYKKIENYYTFHHKTKRSARVRRAIRYVAIFIFVLSIGAALSIFYTAGNDEKYSEIAGQASKLDEAKLILSDGEEILLKEKQTDLQFSSSGDQIVIDHDSIINYNKVSETRAMAQIVIPYGKRSNILLSDGTKVWLNAGSKLMFPQKFYGKNRKVFLKGEAYFEVFKNKEIPFIVKTDNIDITVHGTEFNVSNSDNELEVVLVEGTVSLKENSPLSILKKELRMVPNQKAVYKRTTNETSVESNVNVAYYISWKDGLLEFNRESILNVFNRLSQEM